MNGFLKSLARSFAAFSEDIYRDIIRKTPFKSKPVFLKNIDSNYTFTEIEHKFISLDELSIQYNPYRFKQYKSVHKGGFDSVLDLNQSPHCKLLRDYNNTGNKIWRNFRKHPYYRLQRRFGKSRKTALKKSKKLIALFDDIKTNGFKDKIAVIDKPLVPNPYNNSYEIYDGHHRAACCIVLGIKNADTRVLRAASKRKDVFYKTYTSAIDIVCADCSNYTYCSQCDSKGDKSIRRCQRKIEIDNYTNLRDMDVLEIGCGTKEKGGYIKAIVEKNNCRWTGIDILPTNLASRVCRVEKMPFSDKSFDAVIGSQTFEHWEKPMKALKEIRRVLRDDGFVSLTAPIHLHGHRMFVSGDFDIIQNVIFKSGFKIDKFETWRRKHSDLPVYEPNNYNKKYLRRARIFEYDNIEIYLIHFILKKSEI